MELFLFTNFFPHPGGEFFIANEFTIAKSKACRITVFPLYGINTKPLPIIDTQVQLLSPVLQSPKHSLNILLNGLFCWSSCSFHLHDLLVQNLIFKPKKLYWWLVSVLVTRSILASRSYKVLLAEIKKTQQPVLYFYWGDNTAWIIPYLKKDLAGKPLKVVIRTHRTDLMEQFKANYAPIRKFIFNEANLIATISKNGLEYLKSKYPQYHSKFLLARLGVFDRGLNPYKSQESIHFISVSNVVALKRLHLIFEILQNMKTPCVWHHFGDGVLMPELQQLILKKRKSLEISLHGYVSNESLLQFYQKNSLDAFINTSSIEGVPVSVMEAMSFGLPIIATNVGGSSELVDNKVGFLLDADFSIKSVAHQLDVFFNDKKSVLQTRINARKVFEEKAQAEKNYNSFYELISE
jgi:colanic acid/amylovoran biosynthesis glycosyltransferase